MWWKRNRFERINKQDTLRIWRILVLKKKLSPTPFHTIKHLFKEVELNFEVNSQFTPCGSRPVSRAAPQAISCTRRHTSSMSPLAAHLACAPPSLTALRCRDISKMAAVRAAPALEADTGTPRVREARRELPHSVVPEVPPVPPLRDDARDDARDEALVALKVPPETYINSFTDVTCMPALLRCHCLLPSILTDPRAKWAVGWVRKPSDWIMGWADH